MVMGARSLHRSLDWLDAAREPPLDLGTRYLVDYLAASLVADDAEVTVAAATHRSYATVANPLRQVFELSGAMPSPSQMVIVVFVPRREQRSGLLHPLIIHELGHAANKQHALVRRVLGTRRGQEVLATVMGDARERTKTSSRHEPEDVAVAVEAVANRLKDWIEEALCDAIAVQILGPTYLYSFMAIVGTSDLSAAGDEHPCTRQRIRLLLDQLDGLGWASLMKQSAPTVDAWFREVASERDGEVAGEQDDRTTAEIKSCATALANLSQEIVGAVAEHLGELTLQSKDLGPVLAEIDELLTVGVPPSQTRERFTIGRAAIILGSWLFAVKAQGGDLDSLAIAADVPELSLLLPKALQDAAVLEASESM